MIGMYLFLFGYPLAVLLSLVMMWRLNAERRFLSLTIHKGFFKAVAVSLFLYFGLIYAVVYGVGPFLFDSNVVSKEEIGAHCALTASMMSITGIILWPWTFAIHYDLFSRERVELLVPDKA